MADLVLIHGSTQSPAGFGPLVAALADRGHRAFTPWIRGEPTASAVEHAEVLAAQLPADLVAPVVFAHSAAGLLPAVARRLDAVHQIWLAAAVADYPNRRSLLTELQADPQTMVNPEWLGVDPTADPARISSSYLLPRADSALRVAWMARVARERLGVEPIDVDGGHNLYVARPELVAEVIATQI